MSIIASCSAMPNGSSHMGKMFPRMIILALWVIRARMDAPTLVTPCMQKGVLWCSLSARPSKPISSA